MVGDSSPPPPPARPDASDDARLLLEQLSSEYKILQDKIDKIGAFRFTVKGWSVTLVIASIFATAGDEDVNPLVLLFLLVFVVLFNRLERKQMQWSDIFGERSLKI